MQSRAIDCASAAPRPQQLAARDWLLVALAFSSGVFEAICFLSFGKVFVGFQTGNIVFLGIIAAGSRPPLGPQPVTVLVSLAAFTAGAAVAMPILKPIVKSFSGDQEPASDHAMGVWPWPVSATLAGTVAAEAGFLAAWLATSPSMSLHSAWILTGLAALAMGIQMNAIRVLHVPAISTTAGSATYIGLISGIANWSLKVPEARRLSAVLVALAAGALYGDLLLRYAHAWAPVLPVVVTAAVVTTPFAVLRQRSPRGPNGDGTSL